MACNKEKEVLFCILDMYKDMPYLWQKEHKDYMNKYMRAEAFKVLLGIYKNFDENATVKTIKKKIENMRTSYAKELKKVQASKHTGAGADEVYVPTLWYFDALNFLGSRTETCRTVTDSLENEITRTNSLECVHCEKCQKFYSKYKPDYNVLGLKKKINILRTTFNRQHKKLEQLKLQGCEDYTASWFYDALKFLKKDELFTQSLIYLPQGNKKRKLTEEAETKTEVKIESHLENSNIESTKSELSNDSEQDNNDSADHGSISLPDPLDEPEIVYKNDSGSRPRPETGIFQNLSEYDAVGINVGKKLSKMDPNQALYAESIINNVLRRGLLKKLRETTGLCDRGCGSRQ